MKNVLAIIGSPRKTGNTYKAVKTVEEVLKSKGSVNVDYVYLSELNLELCRGCFLCISKGEDKCPIKDRKNELDEKINRTDGVIFSSPVYGMTMSAHFKNFIDRYAYNGHRPVYFKKRAVLVVSTGMMGIKETLDAMSFVDAWGFDIVVKTGVVTPPLKLSEKLKRKNNGKLVKAGQKLYNALYSEKKEKASFSHYMSFIGLRTITKDCASLFKDAFPADYKYFKENGWHDKKSKFFLRC